MQLSTGSTPLAALALAFAFSTATAAQTLIHQFDGSATNDWLGRSVDGAGDVNGDGWADLVVGVPNADPGGVLNAGQVFVFSGIDGSVLHSFEGDGSQHLFGWAVAGVGDFDGDGFDDVAASAINALTNYVRVFSGFDGAVIYTWNGSNSDWFGYSLSGAGDVDGDGKSDVIIGVPQPLGSGYVQVRGTSVFGMSVRTFLGAAVGDYFGYSVSGGADATGDGIPDILVGAPEVGSNGTGYVKLFNGANGSLVTQKAGAFLDDEFGSAVCLEGDVDGDGRADLVVGSPGYPSGQSQGRVTVWPPFSGGAFQIYDGFAFDDRFGKSVGVADQDCDGLHDVIVGAPGDDRQVLDSGSVTVRSATGGINGTLRFTVFGDLAREGLGEAVAGAGSVVPSGGRAAVIVGAPSIGESLNTAWARVYSGFGGQQATVTFRNRGSNPSTYRANPAIVGGSFTATVDNATIGQVTSVLFAFDSTGSVVLTGGQVVLCLDLGGNGELLTGAGLFPTSSVAGIDSYQLAVQNLPALCGATVCTQAIQFGSPPFVLSNAQDLLLGSY